LEDQDIDGHIMLKCIVEERGVDWIQLAQDTVRLWVDYHHQTNIKCSVELVSILVCLFVGSVSSSVETCKLSQ
jgi:hypothetical protein